MTQALHKEFLFQWGIERNVEAIKQVIASIEQPHFRLGLRFSPLEFAILEAPTLIAHLAGNMKPFMASEKERANRAKAMKEVFGLIFSLLKNPGANLEGHDCNWVVFFLRQKGISHVAMHTLVHGKEALACVIADPIGFKAHTPKLQELVEKWLECGYEIPTLKQVLEELSIAKKMPTETGWVDFLAQLNDRQFIVCVSQMLAQGACMDSMCKVTLPEYHGQEAEHQKQVNIGIMGLAVYRKKKPLLKMLLDAGLAYEMPLAIDSQGQPVHLGEFHAMLKEHGWTTSHRMLEFEQEVSSLFRANQARRISQEIRSLA